MNKIAATAVVALAVGVVGVVAPTAANAAGNGCYAEASDRVTADDHLYYGGGDFYWVSNPVFVTYGSPCRDVNLRGSWNSAAGQSQCLDYRIRFTDPDTGYASPWTQVCHGWVVAFPGATENDVFVVESRGAPGSVVVRS